MVAGMLSDTMLLELRQTADEPRSTLNPGVALDPESTVNLPSG
jgi:hypothetical protein